jgi:hypothetical protein
MVGTKPAADALKLTRTDDTRVARRVHIGERASAHVGDGFPVSLPLALARRTGRQDALVEALEGPKTSQQSGVGSLVEERSPDTGATALTA